LLSLALASLTLVTSLGGNSYAWGSPEIIGLALVAVLSTLGFLAVEKRAEEPIIPLGLFKMNVFWVTSVIGFVAGAAMFGAITFMPIYLQIAQGATPTVSGLLLIPMTIGILVTSTLAGRYMGKTGKYRILTTLGMALLTIGMILLSLLQPDTSRLVFGLSLGTVGLGMGFIFPVVTTSVQNVVPRELLGTATAAGIMFRQVGGSLAVALFGAIFAARMAASMGASNFKLAEGQSLGPRVIAGLPPEIKASLGDIVVNAMHPIYWLAAALALVGLAFSFVLHETPLTNRMVPKTEDH